MSTRDRSPDRSDSMAASCLSSPPTSSTPVGTTTPRSLATQLLSTDPENAKVIKRYINGEELNMFSEPRNERFIIDFGSMTEEQAATFAAAFALVKIKVRNNRPKSMKGPWWQFERPRPELYKAIRGAEKCFVISQISKYLAFERYSTDFVFSQNCIVFAIWRDEVFCILQSRVHET